MFPLSTAWILALMRNTEPFLHQDMMFTFTWHIWAQSSRNITRSLPYWSFLWLFGSEIWTCEESHLSASADLQKTCSALKHVEIDPAGLFTSSTHLGVLPRHLRMRNCYFSLNQTAKFVVGKSYNHRECCSQLSQLRHKKRKKLIRNIYSGAYLHSLFITCPRSSISSGKWAHLNTCDNLVHAHAFLSDTTSLDTTLNRNSSSFSCLSF